MFVAGAALQWDGTKWVNLNRRIITAKWVPVTDVDVSMSLADPGTVAVSTQVGLTATVLRAGTTTAATGSVQFYSGSATGTPIGSGQLNASGVATATWNTPSTAQTVNLYAVYVPTDVFASATRSRAVKVTGARTGTVTLDAAWAVSYAGSGAARGADPLYRGYYDSTNGDQRSWVGWSRPALPAGATVTKAEVYLYAEHWFSNGGGTLSVGVHGLTAKPGASPAVPVQAASATWTTKTGGKWIVLPTDQGWASGAVRGVVLRPAGGTSQATYSYFTGGTNPKLRLTYTY